MPRRLSLHIGSHKTGTTTVQATFAWNAARLRQHGLAWVEGSLMPNLHQFLGFVDPATILPGGYHVHDPALLARTLAAPEADHVVASSENFSFFFTQGAIDALAAALRPLFDDIRIIVYLRRQDRHAISHHQEGAKPDRRAEGALWGHALTPLPDPSPAQRLYLDYDARLTMWENAFGRESLQVRLFDRALLKGGDIIPDILDLLGVPVAGIERLRDRNVSLDPIRAKIGHLSNDILKFDPLTGALQAALPQTDDRMLPSQDQARAFLEPYLAGNRRLNARLRVSDQPDLFPDDFSDYPAEPTPVWTEARTEATLRTVFETLASDLPQREKVSADDFRLAAAALRKLHPQVALRLINAAHELRPNGPAILRMRAEIRRELEARKSDHPADQPKAAQSN